MQIQLQPKITIPATTYDGVWINNIAITTLPGQLTRARINVSPMSGSTVINSPQTITINDVDSASTGSLALTTAIDAVEAAVEQLVNANNPFV